MAEEGPAASNPVQGEQQSQEQNVHGDMAQEQTNAEGKPATEQQQSAEMGNDQTQASKNAEQTQAAGTTVNQTQAANNGTEVKQTQTATADVDRQQSYEETGSAQQGQNTKVEANQDQVLAANGEASATQGQDVTVDTSQSQKVLVGDAEKGQEQGAQVVSEQDQYAKVAKDSESSVKMNQGTTVTSSQKQQLPEGQAQETAATNVQTQDLQTKGTSELGQNQSVDAKQTGDQQGAVAVATKNVLTIFERATKLFVSFLQDITIGDYKETIVREYELKSDELSRSQVETVTYEWGTVTAANCGRVQKNTENSIQANIISFISVTFGLETKPVLQPCGQETVDPKPEQPKPEQPKPEAPKTIPAPVPQVLDTVITAPPVATPTVQANKLPDTATNDLNLILLGLGLAAGGSLLYFGQRRKSKA